MAAFPADGTMGQLCQQMEEHADNLKHGYGGARRRGEEMRGEGASSGQLLDGRMEGERQPSCAAAVSAREMDREGERQGCACGATVSTTSFLAPRPSDHDFVSIKHVRACRGVGKTSAVRYSDLCTSRIRTCVGLELETESV